MPTFDELEARWQQLPEADRQHAVLIWPVWVSIQLYCAAMTEVGIPNETQARVLTLVRSYYEEKPQEPHNG